MSSLGIRAVLPYTGANGIKIEGSVISINPNGVINTDTINVKEILLNASTATDANNLVITPYNINITYNFDDGAGNTRYRNMLISLDGITIIDRGHTEPSTDDDLIAQYGLNFIGLNDNQAQKTIFNIDGSGNATMSSIKTIGNTSLAPLIIFDSVGVGVGVPNANLSGSIDSVSSSININQ